MRSVDIDFALSVILHTLTPPVKQQVTPSGGGSTKRHLSVSDSGAVGRTTSVKSHHGRKVATAPGDLLQTVAFLGNSLVLHTRLINAFKRRRKTGVWWSNVTTLSLQTRICILYNKCLHHSDEFNYIYYIFQSTVLYSSIINPISNNDY